MKIRNYPENTLLLVKWIDAEQDCGWMDNEDAIKRPESVDAATTGFYFYQDKEFIYLSSTISKTQRDRIVIPLGCVNKIKVLTYGGKL